MLVYKVKSLRNSPLCSSVARTGTWDGSEDRMWKEESRNTAWTCMGALKKAENEFKLRCASNVKGNENSFYIATLTTQDEQWNQLIQAWIRSRYLIPPVLVFPQQSLPGFYIWRVQGGETLAANSLQTVKDLTNLMHVMVPRACWWHWKSAIWHSMEIG